MIGLSVFTSSELNAENFLFNKNISELINFYWLSIFYLV